MSNKTKQDSDIQVILAALPALKGSRWLISLDHEGKLHTQQVPTDACVMTDAEMLEALNNGMVLRHDRLAKFAMAAISNLESRCDYVSNLKTVNDV
jgi:hypothetical protein